MARESAVVSRIVKAVRNRGGWITKIHGSPYQPKVIDLIGCYRGFFFGIEAKAPGAKGPTVMQQKVIAQMIAAGGVAIEARSVEPVDEILNDFDRRAGGEDLARKTAKTSNDNDVQLTLSFIRKGNEASYGVFITRVEKAQNGLAKNMRRFTYDEIVEIAYAIGLADCLTWAGDESDPRINFTFTSDLQIIALDAALRAIRELRDEYDL